MRVIARRTLRDFWERHPDSEQPLKAWFAEARSATHAEYDRIDPETIGTEEGDELEVLATLVEAYEEKHFPVNTADPVDAILFRMEQQGLDRKDLEAFIGSRHRVSEILNRKRGLSIEMIRRLHAGLGIPLEVLVR